jgi:hypothetical protein
MLLLLEIKPYSNIPDTQANRETITRKSDAGICGHRD